MFRKSIIAFVLIFAFISCEKKQSLQPNKSNAASWISSASAVAGRINSVTWPTYTSYTYSAHPTLSATPVVENLTESTKSFVVYFYIVDQGGVSHLIDTESLLIEAEGVESVLLSGDFGGISSSFSAGWFASKIVLKYSGSTQDVKDQNYSFSGWHVSEGFTTSSSLNQFTESSWQLYNDPSKTPYCPYGNFGYDTNRSGWTSIENNSLLLNTGNSSRRGGEVILNNSYVYNSFKALIKMDLDEPYTLGAIWLWDTNGGNPDAIVMEIYINDNDNLEISCHTYKNSESSYMAPGGVYTTTVDPSSDFIEYKIDWTPDFIRFYFNGGSPIRTITNSSYIPSIALKPAFSYRMTPWSGGPPTTCSPTIPASKQNFYVGWAAW